jgi:hypothetical protein
LELDHVLLAVADLAAAGRELEARHGLASIEGGRHPGWGTANRIVPLGDAYLELVAVVDAAEAAQSTFGSWVARAAPASARQAALLGWAVRTGSVDQVAGRLGLDVAAGSRVARGGRRFEWRTAGIPEAAAEPSLPFFIERSRGTPLPGRPAVTHRTADVRIDELKLEGDADRLAAWLGQHPLPITVRPGTPRLTSVVITGAAGEIVLDDTF